MPFSIFKKSEYIFLALVALYTMISCIAAYAYGMEEKFQPLMYMERCVMMTTFLGQCYILYLFLRIIYISIAIKPDDIFDYVWKELRQGPLQTERLLRALPIFIGFIFFFSTFTSMKQMIPGIHFYSWDQEFAALDNLLHFGVDPWRILHPLLGAPAFVFLLNINYNIWLVMLFAVLYWQLFSMKNPQARIQFFYAFVLCWAMNGTLLATIFSSVGPCFLERLTGSDYYAPLMSHLNDVKGILGPHQYSFQIFALTTQDSVWDKASKGLSMMGGGISAMPSIHITSALLFWLLARKLKSRYEFVFMLFFTFILAGSVYLGWHYAVDGYLAIITTYALWQISGWMADKSTTCKPSVP